MDVFKIGTASLAVGHIGPPAAVPVPAAGTRALEAGGETTSDANAGARRPLDFWAYLERENRRGDVPGDRPSRIPERGGEPCEGGVRGGERAREIAYAMPRLGTVPELGHAGAAMARPAVSVVREVFTPIGTRIDVHG